MNTGLYDLLNVEPDACSNEIKKAYKKQVAKHHPDKGGDPEIFKQVKEAYETLSDPENRAYYDEHGEIKKKQTNIESDAISKILAYVGQWLASGNFQNDPVEIIKHGLDQELLATCENIQTIIKTRENAIKAKERLSSKAENFIQSYIDDEIKKVGVIIEQNEAQKLIISKAMEMIDDYSWEQIQSLPRSPIVHPPLGNFSGQHQQPQQQALNQQTGSRSFWW